MKLVDTHCHINADAFDNDIEETIARAKAEGLERMVVVGFDAVTIPKAIQLAEDNDFIFAATAWHPVDVIDLDEANRSMLIESWNHPKVVAIGETGLDYHWDKSPRDMQQEAFIWHIEESIKRKIPFIVHDRDAHGDVLSILQEQYRVHGPLHGVMHSYSGSVEMAEEFLKLGLHLSISGVVTFKNAKNVKEVVQMVPLDKLLIETDCPYLTPEPYRGKRNEPAYVSYVATEIATLRGMLPDDVAEITTENAKKFFHI